MNRKHVLSIILTALVGAATGLATAEPSLAAYCHFVVVLASLAQPYLAMTSPQSGSQAAQ